jgi:MYXO-CTERM domain-containing protein
MTHAKRNGSVAGVALLTALSAGAFAPNKIAAHFELLAPEAAYDQDAMGDPQKFPPCGPAAGAGMATGVVTPFTAGETITIRLEETIYHPGHFRVALAVNDRSELPDAPPVTPMGGDACAIVEIDATPDFPVLADGMLPHTSGLGMTSFDVTLPSDVECDNCTLQVIQYMRMHGAPCFYYHCADISITGAAMTDGGPGADGGSSDRDSGSASGDGGARRDSGTSPRTDSGPGSVDDVDGGCGCSSADSSGGERVLGVLGLVGLAMFVRCIRDRRAARR